MRNDKSDDVEDPLLNEEVIEVSPYPRSQVIYWFSIQVAVLILYALVTLVLVQDRSCRTGPLLYCTIPPFPRLIF